MTAIERVVDHGPCILGPEVEEFRSRYCGGRYAWRGLFSEAGYTDDYDRTLTEWDSQPAVVYCGAHPAGFLRARRRDLIRCHAGR